METALKHLEEEAREVSCQRQGIEDDLHIRYAKVLRLLAEAQEECLRSLRDAAETVEGRLQTEIDAAREVRARLSNLSSKAQDAAKQSGLQDAENRLLSDADLQRFEECARSGKRYHLSHKSGQPVTLSPDDCFKDIIGTVVIREWNSDETTDTISDVDELSMNAQGSDLTNSSEFSDILKKIDSLTRTVSRYEQTNSLLQSELTTVKQKNVDLSSDVSTLRREMSSHKDTVKLTEREHTYIKDKNSLLCQDVAALQAQNQKLSGDMTTLQGESQKLRGEVVAMQSDNQQVVPKVARVERDLTDLKKEVNSASSLMKGDLTSLQTSVNQNLTAVGTLQSQLGKTYFPCADCENNT